MRYLRPETLEEALAALKEGKALAGGTALTPQRRGLGELVDLQGLGLDAFEITEVRMRVGAMIRLQAFLEQGSGVPSALQDACRLEAGWNLRNMMTVGGALCTADGRSPFLTALSALDCEVHLLPEKRTLGLTHFFHERDPSRFHSLVTEIQFVRPQRLVFEKVARSPADRPLVCAAAARTEPTEAGLGIRLSLGGWGPHPIEVWEEDIAAGTPADLEAIERAAGEAFARADDAWASGAYRSHVATVLARRLINEVLA